MSVYWDKAKRRWRFDYQGTVAGRRIRARKLLPKGWDRAAAKAFDEAEIRRLHETRVEQEITLDSCVVAYLDNRRNLKSYEKVREHLAALEEYCEGRPVSEVHLVAREYLAENAELDKPLAAATVRQRLALLKAAVRLAWKQGLAGDADPTARMVLPAVRNERHVYAGRHDMLCIARACDRPDARALVLLAFYTGMRLGELMRCRVQGDTLVLPDTKNGEPRHVPIHWRVRRYTRMLPLAAPKITLQRAVQRARRRAGLENVRIHDLRHSAASEMINAGVDLYTVGAVLGHKDPRSTKRYAHLATSTLAEAVRKIGKSSPTTKKKAA